MTKTIECKSCGTFVHKVPESTMEVICWECVAEDLKKIESPIFKKKISAQGYPKGWRFMKEFVHSDGKVYHKGIEQIHLKNKLPATVIAPKIKKTKAQKAQDKQNALLEYRRLVLELKKETRKTYVKKLQVEIKKLQKQIK